MLFVCDKGGGGVQKSEIFADVVDGSPPSENQSRLFRDIAMKSLLFMAALFINFINVSCMVRLT